MSLLSPDTLHLLVAPGELLAVSRLGRRRVGDCRCYPVAAGEGGAGHAETLARVFADFPIRRLRLVLADRLLRYLLLPWRDDLRGADEYAAWARHEFVKVYGSAAERWRVVVEDGPPGRDRVVAAVDDALLAGIVAAAAAAGRRVLSARPHFAVAVDAWLATGAAATGWLLLAEPGQACLGHLDAGSWRWLRQQRADADTGWSAESAVAGESVLAGIDADHVTLLAYRPRPASVAGWRQVDLAAAGGFPATADAGFAAAWLG